ILYGGVELSAGERDELLLFADSLVVWGDVNRFGLVTRPRALYAEGQVYLGTGGESFEADALYLDLASGEGSLFHVTVRASGVRRDASALGAATWFPLGLGALGVGAGGRFADSPFLLRAERARVSRDFTLFEGENVLVSTCTFDVPHYAIGASGVRLSLPESGEETPGASASARAELTRPRLELGGRTVLPLPFDLAWDTAWTRVFPRVRLGSSGRLGLYDLNEVPLYAGRALELTGWLDYMRARGMGTGGDASWRGPPGDERRYFGFLDAYYVHDEGDDVTGLPHPEDRGRVRLFSRDDLGYGLRRELELSYLSDRGFLPEFYENEFQTGKEQETTAYFRWLDDNMAATLQGRVRLNDFQTQAEYAPRARWDWFSEPLFASVLPGGRGLLFSTSYEVSVARLRQDTGLGLPDTPFLRRADFDNRLEYPFALGALHVAPFFEGRYSAWSAQFDPSGGSIDRSTLGTGALATTDAWREFRFHSDLLAIDGLRHIMTPSVGYVSTFFNTAAPGLLVPIDAMGTARLAEYVPLSIRNRIQGGRGAGTVDLVDLLVDTRYFPHTSRAETRSAFIDPSEPRSWDTIRADLRLAPADFLGLRARDEWDPTGRGLLRQDYTALVKPDPLVAVALSWRALKDQYEAVEVAADVRPVEQWGFFASSQYDFHAGRFVENRLAVRRYFHRFVLEVTADYDLTDHQTRFAVNFAPLELFQGDGPFAGDISHDVAPRF
ncbi:MAG: hypothetical protein ACRELB_10920, partial [Polyangiaceae bacterium]